MSIEGEHEAAAQEVLETWPGTPEELDVDLYVATRPLYAITEAQMQERLTQRRLAHDRIAACPGGERLVELEKKLMGIL